jgi:hypothetical protein
MKTLSPKNRPKILKNRYVRSSNGYNHDNGAVAFENPGRRKKDDDSKPNHE